MTTHTHKQRMARAHLALEGLSVGDAFGEKFFGPPLIIEPRLATRVMDESGPWRWTDDTAMALDIVDELSAGQTIVPASLSARFCARYEREPWRGYGGGAHQLFERIKQGEDWEVVAHTMFENQGSFGNGGAMRAAPLGAYFADATLDVVARQAQHSAAPTHAHPEGIAGAVAISVAAASVWQNRERSIEQARAQLWEDVLAWTPESQVLDGLRIGHKLDPMASVHMACKRLGNGSKISAQDTVPFCVWSIARHIRHYEDAMWDTVSGLGDRDTTCAIVGGAVVLADEGATVPQSWLERREPLEGIPLSDAVPRYD